MVVGQFEIRAPVAPARKQFCSVRITDEHPTGAPVIYRRGVNRHSSLDEFRVQSVHILDEDANSGAGHSVSGERSQMQHDAVTHYAHIAHTA